jgi:hypothetical protein
MLLYKTLLLMTFSTTLVNFFLPENSVEKDNWLVYPAGIHDLLLQNLLCSLNS